MDIKIIKDIVEYVENVEMTLEREYGTCKELENIKMPDFYYKLKELVEIHDSRLKD